MRSCSFFFSLFVSKYIQRCVEKEPFANDWRLPAFYCTQWIAVFFSSATIVYRTFDKNKNKSKNGTPLSPKIRASTDAFQIHASALPAWHHRFTTWCFIYFKRRINLPQFPASWRTVCTRLKNNMDKLIGFIHCMASRSLRGKAVFSTSYIFPSLDLSAIRFEARGHLKRGVMEVWQFPMTKISMGSKNSRKTEQAGRQPTLTNSNRWDQNEKH